MSFVIYGLSSLSVASEAKASQADSLTAITVGLRMECVLEIKGLGDAAAVLCNRTLTIPDFHKWRSP